MRISRRFQLRLGEPLAAELETFATARGLLNSPAIRLLLRLGLDAELERKEDGSPAALAALVASEHAVLMVASVLPEGQRRMRETAQQAAMAAEERLALLRGPASE